MCRKNVIVAAALLSAGVGLLISLMISSSFWITLLAVCFIAVGLLLIRR